VKADVNVFFTSGGTESCNSLIHGFISDCSPQHIITTSIEHSAMLAPIALLEKRGWSVTHVAPQSNGVVSVGDILTALRDDTALIAVMAANNETGVVQPLLDIAQGVRRAGYIGVMVSDVTQAVGKSDLNLSELFESGVNGVALSGHKIGALPGVGAVVLAGSRFGVCFPFHSLIEGGQQQQGYRSGTENLHGIVTLGAVCSELSQTASEERARFAALREILWTTLRREIPPVERITPEGPFALSNTLMIRVPGCRGDDLVVALDLLDVAISRGSACNSGKQQGSHVLRAMGVSDDAAREFIRLSLDWDATEESVLLAASKISGAVKQMRAVYSGAKAA
jgi:cysteine desulfurase